MSPKPRKTWWDKIEAVAGYDLSASIRREADRHERAGAIFIGMYKGMPVFRAPHDGVEVALKKAGYKKRLRMSAGREAGEHFTV